MPDNIRQEAMMNNPCLSDFFLAGSSKTMEHPLRRTFQGSVRYVAFPIKSGSSGLAESVASTGAGDTSFFIEADTSLTELLKPHQNTFKILHQAISACSSACS